MTDAFLTADELVEATGAKLPDKQRQALDSNGVHYLLRADGKIRTTWTAINHALTGTTRRGSSDDGFNLGALNAPRPTPKPRKQLDAPAR